MGNQIIILKLLSKIIFIMAVNEVFDSWTKEQRLMSLVKLRVIPLQLKLSSWFHASALNLK